MAQASGRQNKSTQAYERLRELLLSGEIPSGERLVEATLAKKLGMSRGPIRESLLRLEAEGLLRSRGTRRSRVTLRDADPDLDELLERYELREQVESGAARLAAKNMNGWQIDQLRSLLADIDTCTQSGDRTAKYDAVERFHEYLVTNCGNPLFAQVYESYQLMPARPISPELEERVFSYMPKERRSHQALQDVVEAIAHHDPQRAQECMQSQIRLITEALRKLKLESPS